jgi:hypothetical protein
LDFIPRNAGPSALLWLVLSAFGIDWEDQERRNCDKFGIVLYVSAWRQRQAGRFIVLYVSAWRQRQAGRLGLF